MTARTRAVPGAPKTLLVIGGAGFLGRALVRRVASDGAFAGVEVRCLDRVAYPDDAPRPAAFRQWRGDAADPRLLREALRGADGVWIRAGRLGGPESVRADRIGDYLRDNTGLVGAVLEACAQERCDRVFFDSTEHVFGDPADRVAPTREAEPRAANFYGASKLIGEKLLRWWADAAPEERSVQISRYARVRAADTRDVIWHMVAAALAERPIRVLGASDRRVDFVHVDDVVAANVAALLRAPRCATYHVSSGRPVSLFELALRVREKVAVASGTAVPVLCDPGGGPISPAFEPLVVGLHWEESNRELGLPAPMELDEMIEETLAWQRPPAPGAG